MIQNHLTARQLDNFRRRCRFTACGEPCDVFTDPAPYDGGVFFATINRNTETGAAWIEGKSYTYADPAEEISPDYLAACKKAPEDTAREIIAKELRRWASMPAGTVSGWSPEQITAEAERIEADAETDKICRAFDARYQELYDAWDKLPGYREDMERGDAAIKARNPWVSRLASWREDIFSSDREVSALGHVLNQFSLI